jgi:hypothetical protein
MVLAHSMLVCSGSMFQLCLRRFRVHRVYRVYLRCFNRACNDVKSGHGTDEIEMADCPSQYTHAHLHRKAVRVPGTPRSKTHRNTASSAKLQGHSTSWTNRQVHNATHPCTWLRTHLRPAFARSCCVRAH